MHTLTGHHTFRVIGDLDLLVAFSHIEVVVDGVGDVHGFLAERLVLSILRNRSYRLDFFFLDVEAVEGDAVFTHGIKTGLIGVEPSQLWDTAQAVDACSVGIAVQLVKSQEGGLLAFAVGRDGDNLVTFHLHEDVGITHPFQLVGALGIEAAVVVGSVGRGEQLLFLRLRRHDNGQRESQR